MSRSRVNSEPARATPSSAVSARSRVIGMGGRAGRYFPGPGAALEEPKYQGASASLKP
jgi:hypothetical protein